MPTKRHASEENTNELRVAEVALARRKRKPEDYGELYVAKDFWAKSRLKRSLRIRHRLARRRG